MACTTLANITADESICDYQYGCRYNGRMNLPALLSEIDTEISRLQRARTALLALDAVPPKRGPGRPKGTVQKTAAKKRTLSPEARAKIAAAQKARWAAAKKGKH